MATINKVTNANVYVEGKSCQGQAEEVTLPIVKQKLEEHKGLGLLAPMEYPSGLDKMESKIKWAGLYPDAMAKLANPFKRVQIQVRGNMEIYDSQGRKEEKPVLATFLASGKESQGGTYKQNTNTAPESNLSVYYYKLVAGGKTIVEVDLDNTIYVVDGEDMVAGFKGNLGI